MIARIQKALNEGDKGFTLIELLVVMIIIGILAAIAIPVFLNQRAKAQDTATKSDVSNVGKEIATYFVDGTGTLQSVSIDGSGNYDIEFSDLDVTAGNASTNVTITATAGGTATTWIICGSNSEANTNAYTYSAADGLQEVASC